MPSKELAPIPRTSEVHGEIITAEVFAPVFTVEEVLKRKEFLDEIVAKVLKEDTDYGIQPGSSNKQKVLKKAGAEKLISTFGLAPHVVKENKIEDWTGADHGGEMFFLFEYQIALYKGEHFLGEATASCNSWEKKYRYQWVGEEEAKLREDFDKLLKRGGRKTLFEPKWRYEKRETTGQYGKPESYWQRFDDAIRTKTASWINRPFGKDKKDTDGYEIVIDETQYRVPNPNAPDVHNTVKKIAFKRCLVAAVQVVTNCSDGFTADVDEDDDDSPKKAAAVSEESEDPGAGMRDEPKKSGNIATTGTGTGKIADPPSRPADRMTHASEVPINIPTDDVRPARKIPSEMVITIEAVRRDPGKEIKKAYTAMWDDFKTRGTDAGYAYEFANRKRFPPGFRPTIEDHVDHLLDLWELLQKYPETVTPPRP